MILPALLAQSAGVLMAGALSCRISTGPLDHLVRNGSADPSARFVLVPSFVRRGLGSLGGARFVAAIRESPRLRARLRDSGTAMTQAQFTGLKVALAASGLLLLSLGGAGLVAVPFLALAGFQLPDFLLGRALTKKRRLLNSEIPQLLDVIAAGTSAGLSAQMALQRSVPAIRGPLADELRSLLDTVSLGGRWRTELAELSSRVNLPDLRRAANAISRTEMLGVSLADTLRDLAGDVRAARCAVATEKARKAPVKMLFPLVFMILPAFLLLTVVPVLLSTLRSIH